MLRSGATRRNTHHHMLISHRQYLTMASAIIVSRASTLQHVVSTPTVSAFQPSFWTCQSNRDSLTRRFFASANSNNKITNLPRLFVDAPTLTSGSILTLSPAQSHYVSVMRLTNVKRWGDRAGQIRIFNGSDGEWLAKVVVTEGSSKKRGRRGDTTIVECVEQLVEQPSQKKDNHSVQSIELYVAPIKKAQRKMALEKATELNVDAIQFIETDLSQASNDNDHDKNTLHVIEASEQCERLTVPDLAKDLLSWDDLLSQIEKPDENENDLWLFCRERSPSSPNILQVLQSEAPTSSTPPPTSIKVAVGPEGGWSQSELDDIEEISAKDSRVRFVSLGSLVLRAETACISALSTVMLFKDQS